SMTAFTAGRIDEEAEHLKRAQRYAQKAPHSRASVEIARRRASKLLVSGRTGELLRFSTRTGEKFRQEDDDLGSAIMLLFQGDAKLALGDPGGEEDVVAAANTLIASGDRAICHAGSTLVAVRVAKGDFVAGRRASLEAWRWATRVNEHALIAGAAINH